MLINNDLSLCKALSSSLNRFEEIPIRFTNASHDSAGRFNLGTAKAQFKRKTALITILGDDSFLHTCTIDVFITKLRKRQERDPAVTILNIRGIGYKIICRENNF